LTKDSILSIILMANGINVKLYNSSKTAWENNKVVESQKY